MTRLKKRNGSATVVLVMCLLIFGSVLFAQSAEAAKYEPAYGKVLFIAGQDLNSLGGMTSYTNGFVNATGIVPGGVTEYISSSNADGISNTANWGAGDESLQTIVSSSTYNNTALHVSIGLDGGKIAGQS